ncbi:Sordarin hypoxysordarin biosynthesis cluster S [Hyphodiscus hymeniophilus]|uniref:Sordarin hypoxysordarin biosynthesis cluster S n=1 Tax=Hyphodiscus hymeniophilus TaxID=353542 RepID=A0A9P6VRE3_9HELO|nr:Sordarin hypoxysordarin biosynthesis cluster S [Hyphodiscus hymeniophilus]
MSTTSLSQSDEHRRKRRGTTCLSQEYPEEHDSPSGNQIGERLGRVEFLLEKLVAKISQYDEEEKAAKTLHTPESLGSGDVLTPYTSNTSVNENAPILSLFDNPVIGRREPAFESLSSISSPVVSGSRTPSCRPTKLERLRQTLGGLLPTQQGVDVLCEESNCWLLMYAFNLTKHKAANARNGPRNGRVVIPMSFNVSEISKQHPTIIARTLLYFAICFQQLPQSFDMRRLQFPTSVEAQSRFDRYISTVQTLVTSDDELVSTTDGLECLILQGIFHINGGNPRRAWLTFRRALNIAQLMGLHKKDVTIADGRDIWFQIVQGDRYLALLLGMPCGSADDEFGPEETFQNADIQADSLFTRKLCNISGSIIERNSRDNIHAYATTQKIEENLEELSKALPASWWAIPTSIPDDHAGAAETFDRMMMHIWFFQLEALLHLPFMLRAATERRYEYSKFACLKASREMMYRYLALREMQNKSFCCKVVDFGALVATVTLLLGVLEVPQASESQQTKEQSRSDRALVRTVMTSMEELATGGDIVTKQCMDVIQTLLSVESPAGPYGGKLRLTIPYFGTINIVRPPTTPAQNESTTFNSMQPPQPQAFPPNPQRGTQAWQDLQYPSQNQTHAPVVSFTSSQFQVHHPEQQQLEDWGLQEADTLFFDSLLNTDLEGNWIF